MEQSFDSFGRIDRGKRNAIAFDDVFSKLEGPDSLLAFGNGRSYGDSCHNDAGLLVPMHTHNRIVSFDPHTGILEAESGVLLSEIIQTVAKYGYFLPVTPGTRFVTLGGAIANDVHGKNHHLRGTFGSHVESLELLRSDGVHYICSSAENAELFAATIGGMGLTGLILNARIRLMPVGSLDVEERIISFRSLSEYFAIAEEADRDNEYAVAWVDQLATGRSEGRGVLMTGHHAINGNRSVNSGEARLGVPFDLPFSMLNKLSLTVFNTLYFHAKRRKQEPHLTGFASFFYPLDGLRNWNRFYGPAGLYQHQSVIPFEAAEKTIPAMLTASRDAGQSSFLTVLKRFGNLHSPGLLSFPKPGYTLTMDFPNRGRKTLDLLEQLDKITVEAGGRVNPYKDQRMSAETFKAGFPEWQQLEDMRDARFCSDFLAAYRIKKLTTGQTMKYIPFILFTVMTNAAAQLLLKYGMMTFSNASYTADTLIYRIFQIVFNPWVFAGLTMFVISMASHMYVLSKVDLSFAYPFLSLAYVAVAVFAWLLFKEELGAYKIAGIAFICIGTVLIAQSGKTPNAEQNVAVQDRSAS